MTRPALHLLVEIAIAAAAGDESALVRALRSALSRRLSLANIREALFQQVVFIGIGRTINAFSVLDRMLRESAGVRRRPTEVRAEKPSSVSTAGFRRRGEAVCRRIYGADYPALRARMHRLHPGLDAWMIEEGYGKIMARRGLDLRCRERMAVGVLAALRLWPQLRSHLLGARRIGVGEAALREALRAAERFLGPADRRRLRSLGRRSGRTEKSPRAGR